MGRMSPIGPKRRSRNVCSRAAAGGYADLRGLLIVGSVPAVGSLPYGGAVSPAIRRRDVSLGTLDIIGPIREGRVLTNERFVQARDVGLSQSGHPASRHIMVGAQLF
jgi:hypothetical protein